jgi:hypothetical protein
MSSVKIFVSPFKGGSTSIGEALKVLGYTTLGHDPNILTPYEYSLIEMFNEALDMYPTVADIPEDVRTEAIDAFEFLRTRTAQWDVFHDWPMGHDCIHPFLKKLLWPDCKFVYLLRPMDAWIVSATNWCKKYHDSDKQLWKYNRTAELTLVKRKEAWQKKYERIHEDVLFMNIDEGWEPLCAFLGKEVPVDESAFPWLNKAAL